MHEVLLSCFAEKFLEEQVESIKKLADIVTKLKRVGPGLGEYLFDKEELQEATDLTGH